MGVTYKLKEEVVHFIVSQRQSNPLASCRQLAESASQKFDLRLSKSSVHDVLKESGITTPRGRKPRDKFEIPQEKKKQIQVSLSQIKLLPDPVVAEQKPLPNVIANPVPSVIVNPVPSVIASEALAFPVILSTPSVIPSEAKDLKAPLDSSANDTVTSPEHEGAGPAYSGAGKIFLKAALWDLGIFSEENIKATDWNYYLTYSKGIKVDLENNRSFFIDFPLPLERCIREAADGLINNVRPFIVHKVSDEELFKSCMDSKAGFKMNSISIVDEKDHILLKFDNIMEFKRKFILKKISLVESNEINPMQRLKAIFFPQLIDNNGVIDNILNLKGFNVANKNENIVTLLINDSYENKAILQDAAEKLNGTYLRDEQDRLVSVKISSC